jgi:DNA anti-recombination protein RmuC
VKSATILFSVLLASTYSLAQPTPGQRAQAGGAAKQGQTRGEQQGKMQGAMADRCKAMMAKRDQMMADMKKMDADLDQKLQVMKNAQGQAKVDAMQAVITEMVEQRRQRQERMMNMQQSMMAHMSQHMAQGGGQMQCPMMSQMGSANQPSRGIRATRNG